jgi:hypothetical protein
VQVQAAVDALNDITLVSGNAIRVTVTVTPTIAANSTVVISGYHTNY